MQLFSIAYRADQRWIWLIGAGLAGLLLAFTPPLVAASWLLSITALGLAICDPVWPVALAVLSVPFQQLVTLPGGLSVTQACLIVVLLSLFRQLSQPWPALKPPGIALVIFIWMLALSAATTPLSRSEALKETLRWTTVLLIYTATVWVLQDPSRISWRRKVLITCLLVAPGITALIGIGQFLTGIGPESFAIAGGRVRAYGTIGQPNSFAGYMNQAWPLAVGLIVALIETRPRPSQFWPILCALGIAAGSLLGGLLTSFSRGGWLGALIGGLITAIVFAGRYGRTMVIRTGITVLLISISSILLLQSGILPPALSNRITSITDNLRLFDPRHVEITPSNFAIVERMAHLHAAWRMLQERPLLGIGPGNFSIAYERPTYSGSTPTWIKPWYHSRGHAHNYYLHIAAESGLIGFSAYWGFIGSIWYCIIRAAQQTHHALIRGIILGGTGVVGALNGHNLFENLHVLNMGIQFGVVIALLATLNTGNTILPKPKEEL